MEPEPEPADAAEEAPEPEPEDEGPTMNEIIRDVADGRVTREEGETLPAEKLAQSSPKPKPQHKQQ